MKRRIVITIGCLSILITFWFVSWNKYQETKPSPDKEEKGKTTERPLRYKRFPANGDTSAKSAHSQDTSAYVLQKSKSKGHQLDIESKVKFSQGQSEFLVVKNLYIAPISSRDSFEKSEIIEEKFKRLIVTRPSGSVDSALVVQNSRTKILGIVTGVFKIKLKDHSQWTEVQDEYEFKLEGNFPGIRLTLLKTSDFQNIHDQLESLSKDSRVERVELEVLENQVQVK